MIQTLIDASASFLQKIPKDLYAKLEKLLHDESVVSTFSRSLAVFIPGEPKAWKRARARTVAIPGLPTVRKFAGMYDPNTTFKKVIADYVVQAMEDYHTEIITAPVKLTVKFYKPIPKSTPAAKAVLYDNQIIMPSTKPDIDNYAKQVQDALNGVLYVDDAQIVELHSFKFASFKPGIKITAEF